MACNPYKSWDGGSDESADGGLYAETREETVVQRPSRRYEDTGGCSS